ncbi:MAG: hypothetical protein OXF07_11330 [Rhodobacter sp.]|nr:hypothetical protein [Rhodobacter sp.]MCY4168162.1 hypothetical protein [Rhodobacter sp.]
MIILDTMVLSEPMKPQPDPAVIAWLDQQVPNDLYTTIINQAEMYYGLYALPDGKKKGRSPRRSRRAVEQAHPCRLAGYGPDSFMSDNHG